MKSDILGGIAEVVLIVNGTEIEALQDVRPDEMRMIDPPEEIIETYLMIEEVVELHDEL